ncbi:hypothetical protein INT47_010155 [Mucor saturninus]|uniref:Glycoside hydrolase family 28 protein n=1 Tax=Mucor saturninus TaxID=64648 RepID=A0A8H7RCJ7_9FUNG|nr:hypothetical protein INT47_010155 [Mucor saturninus]
MVQIYSSITIILATIASLGLVQAAPKTCVVKRSATDDALTIAQAFKDCQTGGTVVFPQGQSFYPKTLMTIKSLQNVNVQFNGNIVLPNFSTKFDGGLAFLQLEGNNIHFDGGGSFVGTGQQWWDAKNNKAPFAFRVVAKDSVFRNFKITNSPGYHVGAVGCENVVFEKITMYSVSKTNNYAYNTDAWAVAWSKNVIFRDSEVTNGDDCTAINGEVSDILVSNIKCTGGHGYSVIGTLSKDGSYQSFKNVKIIDSVCTNCLNGVTVKASPGRPGIMDGITFNNIQLNNVDYPITITDHYFCDAKHTSACYKNDGTGIKFTNIYMTNISGYAASRDYIPIINVDCAPNTKCDKVHMQNIRIKSGTKTVKNICKNLIGSDTNPYCRI